jgi:hypothetical protein
MGPCNFSLPCFALGCLLATGWFAVAVNAKNATPTYSSATLTIYRKGASPIVDTFPAVHSITFTGASRVLSNAAASIVHTMQVRSVRGAVMFNLRGVPATAGVLKLYSISGREIFLQNLQLNGAGAGRIVTPATASGMYIARFTNGVSTLTQTVIPYN